MAHAALASQAHIALGRYVHVITQEGVAPLSMFYSRHRSPREPPLEGTSLRLAKMKAMIPEKRIGGFLICGSSEGGIHQSRSDLSLTLRFSRSCSGSLLWRGQSRVVNHPQMPPNLNSYLNDNDIPSVSPPIVRWQFPAYRRDKASKRCRVCPRDCVCGTTGLRLGSAPRSGNVPLELEILRLDAVGVRVFLNVTPPPSKFCICIIVRIGIVIKKMRSCSHDQLTWCHHGRRTLVYQHSPPIALIRGVYVLSP